MPNDKSLQSDDDEAEIKSTRTAGKLLYSRFDGSISRKYLTLCGESCETCVISSLYPSSTSSLLLLLSSLSLS